MGTLSKNNYRVLVGFDFSELGLMALRGGIRHLARTPGAELHVVGVVSRHGLGPFDGKADQLLVDRVRTEIQHYAERAVANAALDDVAVFAHARIGNPSKEIAALADQQNVDLVVIGTHGRHGIKRLVHSSVAEHVVRDAPCPVLVMRPKSTTAEQFQPEPPCPQCVATRQATGGAQMWCEAHSGGPHDAHTYGGSARRGNVQSWSLYNH
jgi:nucleotide-binding universal stress UspA family protein